MCRAVRPACAVRAAFAGVFLPAYTTKREKTSAHKAPDQKKHYDQPANQSRPAPYPNGPGPDPMDRSASLLEEDAGSWGGVHTREAV